jgi:serine/threonine protein kinase
MADVYLAVARGDLEVNRLVVVKRLREEHANDLTIREMFLNEARLAARLNHPNVIQTFEAGMQGEGEGGALYLAMEYVDGQPLSRILTKLKKTGRRLDPRIAARICADALAGLHYAHELTDFDGTPLQIVHRDVSPQNVMISYDGGVKLVDFGIAKAVGTTQTAHGVFKGKMAFMAPEQVRCEPVDRRADVFAAGIVLWECVAGKLLFAEGTPAATLYNLLSRPIPRASSEVPELSPVLDEIIDRALRRDPDERFPTAKAMHDALEGFIASTGRVAAEEIGDLAKSLFEDTRSKVQTQIRTQLASLSLAKTTESGRFLATDGDRRPVRPTMTGLVDLDELVETAPNATAFRTVAPGKRAAKPPILLRGALVLLPLLAIGAGALALRQRPHVTTEPPAVVSAPSVTAPRPAETMSEPVITASAAPSAAPHESASAKPIARTPPARWSPPAPTTPASTAPPAPPPPVPRAAPSITAEPAPQGRTFRREL